MSDPFCTLHKIYDFGQVSKNWPDLKHAVNLLVKYNLMQCAVDSRAVCFVRKFLTAEEKIHANHLDLINTISHMIDLEKKGSIDELSYRQKTIKKFLDIYRQAVKIMDLEYRITKALSTEWAENKRVRREGEIVQLLQPFMSFLSGDKRGPILSGRFKTDEELLSHLDFELSSYQNYYGQLKQNANPRRIIVQTLHYVLLGTKKDASEMELKTMKQISNRINPFLKVDGSPDFAKLYNERRIEGGMGMFYEPSDIILLVNLHAIKETYRATQDKRERKKIKKEAETMYPGITFQ